MISTHCKNIFLLIAFFAIKKDLVFAENLAENLAENTTSEEEATTLEITTTTTSNFNDTEEFTEYIIMVEDEKTLTDDLDIIKNFNYVIYDENTGVPCILTNMGITLTVPYETENNEMSTKNIRVPLNANVTGTCEENLSLITLAWQETDFLQETISDNENSLTMRLRKEGDIFYVQYLVVSIYLDIANFPNATGSTVLGNSSNDLKLFPAPVQLGMHLCNETRDVQVDPILVQFHNLSIIAFNNETDFSKKLEEYCAPEDQDTGISENVTIGAIVGGVLVAILIIALIVFFAVKRSMRNSTSWNILRKKPDHEGC